MKITDWGYADNGIWKDNHHLGYTIQVDENGCFLAFYKSVNLGIFKQLSNAKEYCENYQTGKRNELITLLQRAWNMNPHLELFQFILGVSKTKTNDLEQMTDDILENELKRMIT